MTKEEIIQGNILIADFMGMSKGDVDGFYFIEGFLMPAESLNYQGSYEWIMQVVEKIHSTPAIIFEFTIALIPFCRIMYTPKYQPHKVFMSEERQDITGVEAIYQCVVQFIKWYNDNEWLKENRPKLFVPQIKTKW